MTFKEKLTNIINEQLDIQYGSRSEMISEALVWLHELADDHLLDWQDIMTNTNELYLILKEHTSV